MTIQALPCSTVTVLGASQVLVDPSSCVKELIDNALDARSTAIFVEVALNTLDVIQVRDNGHGIAPEDRELVCKRHCTSKIRNSKDLRDVGGRWLGFRGEALASAAELCGGLTVTTRVEGESTAEALKVAQSTQVIGQDRDSHPVGTTIRLTDLFKNLPVRRQTALKATNKCLAKIKRTLQAYAFARPNTRFSLRVLKAKNDKANWMYVPKSETVIGDAAMKIVGKDCASQCFYNTDEFSRFEVEALLPRPDAENAKVSNVGHFISVDSRPVSSTRGTINQVVKMFKEHLKQSSRNLSDAKDPFCWINIRCPPGSYDANVEPSKDDVVFQDPQACLDAVRKVLDSQYPGSSSPARIPTASTDEITSGQVEIFEDSNAHHGHTADFHLRGRQHREVTNDDISLLSDPEYENENETTHSLQNSNPFSFAKLNALTRKRTPSISHQEPLRRKTSSDMNRPSPSYTSTDVPDFEEFAPRKRLKPFPSRPPWASFSPSPSFRGNLPTPDRTSSPLRGGLGVDDWYTRERKDAENNDPRAHRQIRQSFQPVNRQARDMVNNGWNAPGAGQNRAGANDFTTARDFAREDHQANDEENQGSLPYLHSLAHHDDHPRNRQSTLTGAAAADPSPRNHHEKPFTSPLKRITQQTQSSPPKNPQKRQRADPLCVTPTAEEASAPSPSQNADIRAAFFPSQSQYHPLNQNQQVNHPASSSSRSPTLSQSPGPEAGTGLSQIRHIDGPPPPRQQQPQPRPQPPPQLLQPTRIQNLLVTLNLSICSLSNLAQELQALHSSSDIPEDTFTGGEFSFPDALDRWADGEPDDVDTDTDMDMDFAGGDKVDEEEGCQSGAYRTCTPKNGRQREQWREQILEFLRRQPEHRDHRSQLEKDVEGRGYSNGDGGVGRGDGEGAENGNSLVEFRGVLA
ncbi:MAG: hypothetical protein M1831_000948 [Alyxoria varia]|nr:MAG: hypothetical protein M1831_000948 [Alyxoria varia]